MDYLILIAAAIAGGLIQAVSGFGSVIIMMVFLPLFFPIVDASAIAATIVVFLEIFLAYRFRKDALFKQIPVPAAFYLLSSITALLYINKVDKELLSLILGCFLLLLSVFMLCFSKRLRIRANWKTAAVCGAISGVFSGLFGIGGPLMAAYFLDTTDSKESYIGTLQCFFFLTGIVNLGMRCATGILTLRLVPMIAVGTVSINLGKYFGLKILGKLNTERMKKIVYLFIGVSGIITIMKYFFN